MKPLNLLPHEAAAAARGSLAMVWRPVVPQPEFAGLKSWERGHWSEYDDKWDFLIPNPNRPGYLQSNLKGEPIKCPLGPPGTLLYGREAWQWYGRWRNEQLEGGFQYRADLEFSKFTSMEDPDARWHDFVQADAKGMMNRWRSAATMPKWASRTTLRVVSVVVKRVGEVTEEEARAWGCRSVDPASGKECLLSPELGSYRLHFEELWDQHYGKKQMYPGLTFAWGVRVERVGGGE